MTDNIIQLSKHMPSKTSGIDIDVAKRYFIEEVLPYIGRDSLLRLIQENTAGDQHSIQTELMRLFIESEINRPAKEDAISYLNLFFDNFYANMADNGVSEH